MHTVEARIAALELAVVALARAEFGDIMGHLFHGNQWTDGYVATQDLVNDDKVNVHREMGDGKREKIGSVTQMKGVGSAFSEDRFVANPKSDAKKSFASASAAVQHVIDRHQETDAHYPVKSNPDGHLKAPVGARG